MHTLERMWLPRIRVTQLREEELDGAERHDRRGQWTEGENRETGQGEVGSAGRGVDCDE